jgi:DNA repair protein RadC
MAVKIRDIPEDDRPRERLLRRGPEALSDRELLALVLRNGRRGENALDIAAGLLVEYGSLTRLASALPEELANYPGVGVAKAASLIAAFRLGRLADQPDDATVLRSAADVAAIAMRELQGARREKVIVLICDASNRLMRVVCISEGAVDSSLFPVREILNAVLRNDGRAFAISHNHPSGNPQPSRHDHSATTDLCAAAVAVGIRFLDHVIVGGSTWTSVKGEQQKRD